MGEGHPVSEIVRFLPRIIRDVGSSVGEDGGTHAFRTTRDRNILRRLVSC